MAKVLVIDDEAALRVLIRRVLEEAGHSVTEAPNGRKGLQIFESEEPDLVVTDILMPEGEGLETIRAIRDGSQVPIIVLSGGGFSASLNYLDTALAFGANHALNKPFRPRELVALVERAIAGKAGT